MRGRVQPEGGTVVLAADGSFTLKTLFHEEWLPGAVAGANRSVQIRVPLGPDQLGGLDDPPAAQLNHPVGSS